MNIYVYYNYQCEYLPNRCHLFDESRQNNSLFHKQYHMQKFELMIPKTKQSLLKWEQMG